MNNEKNANNVLIRTIQTAVSDFDYLGFDVWELINEVWLQGRVQKVAFPRYLPSRVRYDVLDAIRRIKKTRRKHQIVLKSDDLLAEKFSSPKSAGLSLVEQKDSFEFFTKNLPAKQREAIYQIFWEGKSQREAAVALGITQGAVCGHLKRAIRAIEGKVRKEQYDSK